MTMPDRTLLPVQPNDSNSSSGKFLTLHHEIITCFCTSVNSGWPGSDEMTIKHRYYAVLAEQLDNHHL
jgi:hypothetical protein